MKKLLFGCLTAVCCTLLYLASASGLVSSALGSDPLHSLDIRLQDAVLQSPRVPNPNIFVVGVDEGTLRELGPWHTWGRDIMAQMIETLTADPDTAPAVIGINVSCLSTTDPQQDAAQLAELRNYRYTTLSGDSVPLLTDLEYDQLSVRKGNLTDTEREIMQAHVSFTAKLLSKIQFGKGMEKVPQFASMHHECLNGSGYPLGLHDSELPTEARALSIIDIYEALTSSDRPYKAAMPAEKAFGILDSMVGEGKLDGELVKLFHQCMLQAV